MAWPPSTNYNAGFIQETLTTAYWGTDGMLVQNAVTFIVKSIRTVGDNEKIYIDNGNGVHVGRIRLLQGREVEMTLVADSRFTIPIVSGKILVVDPLVAGGAINFSVDDRDGTATRKADGEFTIRAKVDWLVDGVNPY